MPISRAAPVLLIALAGCGVFGGEKAATTTTSSTIPTLAAIELTVGDCFNGLVVGRDEAAEVGSVVPVGCEEPHDLEVFDAFEFGGQGDTYPGVAAVSELAEKGCAERFVNRIGEDSSLGNLALWPSEASWSGGDRRVICSAYKQTGGRLVVTIR